MRRYSLGISLAAAVLAAPAWAADRIHIASSSTVAPFVSTAAEQFGRGSGFATPVIESIGSGGGLKLFCASLADGSPDIAGASRRITESEKKSCAANGVTDITEIAIGYDGIVLATPKSAAPLALTGRQLFLSIAKSVPVDGKLGANPYKTWREIDAGLPGQAIMVFGPAPNHGTRDVLADLVMSVACKGFPEIAALEGEARRVACQAMREDGAYIDVTADYTVILRKLEAEPSALGILPFGYLERNRDKIRAASFEGIMPSYQTIYDGSYPLSRPLYIYVKKAHLQTTRGLREFVAELTSDKASGKEGYLADLGLISLPEAQRKAEAQKARSFPTL
jgi:phosphate transport system substrate-binding protein